MFDTLLGALTGLVDDHDAAGAFAAAAACRRIADLAEARLLRLAAHVADLHPVLDGPPASTRLPGMERLVPLAGEGTPEVAEFAPAELGAALAMTTPAATAVMGEALELRHRLPRTWARVHAGKVPAWRARLFARETMILTPEAAAHVDSQIAPVADTLTVYRARQVVAAAMLRFDPERAARDAQAAAETRGVRLRRGHDHGVVHVDLDLDAPDATAFDTAITQIAGILAAGGDADPLQVRRARAVGVLAHAQHSLALTAKAPDAEHTRDIGNATRGGDDADGEQAPLSQPQRRGVGAVTLHVHLTDTTLATGVGLARVEGLGPVTAETVRRWVGHQYVTLRPVVHTSPDVAVDCYEIPDQLREAVVTAVPYCMFPWCNHSSRDCDLDHTVAYRDPADGGPPAQTRPDNLGPLCRRHRRIKTHSPWRVDQPEPGVYIWTSPHGTRYRVDPTGTTALSPAA